MSLLILSCIGLTLVLKQGQPTRFIRDWLISKSDWFYELFSCSLCLGFWVGVMHMPFYGYDWKLPFVSAAASFMADCFIQACQKIANPD